MANSVLDWVWDHSRSRHGSRLVLLSLADSTNQPGGLTWPSNAELMRRTGLGARAVQAAVIDLAKLGEIEVEYNGGPRGCNRYRVLITPADIAGVQKLRGAKTAGRPKPNKKASAQAKDATPADIAPPAISAPPQISTPDPAISAHGTVREPQNSSTKSSGEGGPGGTLFGDQPPKPGRSARRRPSADADFERWYQAYPVHKARGDAEKAWAQVMRAGADPEDLIAAAERYREDPQVLRGYGKYPSGWLRAKCWLDEPSAEPQPPSGSNGYQPYRNPDQSEYDKPMFPSQETPQ